MDKEYTILATPNHSQESPSKKYILGIDEIILDNVKYWKFSIYNIKNKIIFDSKQLYDIRHNTFFLWDDIDNVWVYSGDIGTFIWVAKKSNWNETSYSKTTLDPPKFLIKKYPNVFKFKIS